MSEPHFVFQRDEFFSGVVLDGPSEADIFFTDQALDGEPLATVDDVVGALERDPDLTATVVGTREAQRLRRPPSWTIVNSSVEPVRTRTTHVSAVRRPRRQMGRSARRHDLDHGDTRWARVISAEWFEPEGMEPAQALAAEILDSIVIGS